ncbi:hypothetical protein AB0P21_07980 [Kribbella sp. NPDC056861]|uniref:hypothetical protein n=1 Tax=Kribbella sp. NPDC056861 TaxID=3154857 RepID=UPI0034329540
MTNEVTLGSEDRLKPGHQFESLGLATHVAQHVLDCGQQVQLELRVSGRPQQSRLDELPLAHEHFPQKVNERILSPARVSGHRRSTEEPTNGLPRKAQQELILRSLVAGPDGRVVIHDPSPPRNLALQQMTIQT